MKPGPLTALWNGEAFEPLPSQRRDCDERFVVGQYYRLAEVEERSSASHGHQFAWLHDAWQNLPEDLKDLYPSVEHLRKRGLITAGFYNEEAIDAGTNAAALRVAGYARKHDEFALVVVRGPIVLVRSAKSQSRRAMTKDEFQRSKENLMEIVAALVGVTPSELQANTGKAA